MIDLGLAFAYIEQGKWKERDPSLEKTKSVKGWLFIMAFLPYWFRFC
jgi:hypothetical protein